MIGIDPSLTGCAVCWDNDGQHHVTTFSSKSQGQQVAGRIDRAVRLATQVQMIVCRLKPQAVFVEGYSFGSKNNREYLGEFGGILRMMLFDIPVPVWEVAPSALKKFITGTGKGKKELMIGTVAKRFGLITDSSDEVDAFCVWRFGRAVCGLIPDLHKYELETVNKWKDDNKWQD